MEAPRPLPGPRRHRRARRLARCLCLGSLSLALLGPAVAPASAVVGPGVEIVGPGVSGGVSEADIKKTAEGEPVRQYVLRGTPGEVGQSVPRQGVPVGKVIELAGLSFDGGYLTIPRTNGTVAYLPAEDFGEPSPFENGLPAVISTDEGSIRFLRPLLASEPEGVNAEDNIATVSGEALLVGIHQGHVVEVGVTPSSTSTSAGTPVQFTAAASGGEAGETFTYLWSFGDGTTAEGESVPHVFSGSGTFQVRVTAIGSQESGGESGPVEVVVGNPPTTEVPGATTTPQPTATKPTGAPGKGREGRSGNGPKPSPGGGKKPKQGKPDSSTQRSESLTARPRPDHSPEPPVPAPTPLPSPEPLPTAPSPPPEAPAVSPPTLEEPSGGASAEPPGCCSAEAPPDGSPEPTSSQGDLVEGRLVGDDLGPTTLAEPLDGSSEGEGSRSAAGAVGDGGVGAPVGALIVVALLAGGALFEWRRSRPIR